MIYSVSGRHFFLLALHCTCGAEAAYTSEAPEFPLSPRICCVRIVQSLVLYVVFCRVLLCLYALLLTTVLSVLRFMAPNDHFGIFKLFSHQTNIHLCGIYYINVIFEVEFYISWLTNLTFLTVLQLLDFFLTEI
jgi:hypothetical protein